MKKYVISFVLLTGLVSATTVGIIMLNSESQETDQPQKTSESTIPSNSQDDINQDEPEDVITTKANRTIGLKYWDTDKEPFFLLNFNLKEDYKLNTTTEDGQPAIEVSFDGGHLVMTISHAEVYKSYSQVQELQNSMTDKLFYRVNAKDRGIRYTDNILFEGDCPSAIGAPKILAPCGTPVYGPLIVECSSANAVKECDEVMKTLTIEDGPQLKAIEE